MNKQSKKHPTLYDVAEQCGVSYQTVSRVINDSPHVSARTRKRVQEAIRALNYRPNRAAQTLVTRRSSILEVVTFGATYYGPGQMMASLEKAARTLGYRLMFSSLTEAAVEDVSNIVESLRAQSVDGVFIINPVESEIYTALDEALRGIPTMKIGATKGARTASVVIDQYLGAQLATQHLIDCGHRHIAAIQGPSHWHDALARREGWMATLLHNNLEPGPTAVGDWTARSGYKAACHLLDSQQDFTAMVVANDQMALGAISALKAHQLAVPGDVSVVGFDDIPESAFFDPPLTTVRQDFTAMGKQAIEYLVEILRNPEAPIHQRTLYPEIVLRQSVRSLV